MFLFSANASPISSIMSDDSFTIFRSHFFEKSRTKCSKKNSLRSAISMTTKMCKHCVLFKFRQRKGALEGEYNENSSASCFQIRIKREFTLGIFVVAASSPDAADHDVHFPQQIRIHHNNNRPK